MNYYLPKVNISIQSNYLHAEPSSISLHYYINTLPKQDSTQEHENILFKLSKYKPLSSYFFIFVELLLRNTIYTNGDILTIGSNSGIEAHEWIKQTTKIDNLYQLILSDTDDTQQILNIIKMQVKGGYCIFKVLDTTNIQFIKLLYLFCACYTTVYVCKPDADCNTSLVKYIICTEFIKNINVDYQQLIIPYYFFVKINELNSIFGQLQLEHLRCPIESKEKIINWCSEFSIPI
jgi:hypothetical protein